MKTCREKNLSNLIYNAISGLDRYDVKRTKQQHSKINNVS
jgi:hypothetical protein